MNLDTIDILAKFCKKAKLFKKIEAMASGKRINTTENRSVLHTALRLPKDHSLTIEGVDIVK